MSKVVWHGIWNCRGCVMEGVLELDFAEPETVVRAFGRQEQVLAADMLDLGRCGLYRDNPIWGSTDIARSMRDFIFYRSSCQVALIQFCFWIVMIRERMID